MNILVNGIGNIGTSLLNILNEFKEVLEIENIYALKNTTISNWNKVELDILSRSGIKICTKHKSDFIHLESIINNIDYIFDANANSFGLKNKQWYNSLPNLKGCSAQGSEKNFGIPFMSGINDDIIINKKFVQIVSCNTHSLSSIISVFTNNNFSKLIEGDFVIVRRSEDLGNHQRLVSANVVSRHLDKTIGTHHAIDVKDLFNTKDIYLDIQSSDITTPSQLMHTVRFNLKLKDTINISEINKQIQANKYVSTSSKFDSNIIFDLGRRYSLFGRLYSHTIINDNNILIDTKNNRIKAWAFIPQEGNTILSTIHAFLLQTKPKKAALILDILLKKMIYKEW